MSAPDPLDRIARHAEYDRAAGRQVRLVPIEQLLALVEVARAARALQETEWFAFIGWQPSTDRQQAIESCAEVLAAALARLDKGAE